MRTLGSTLLFLAVAGSISVVAFAGTDTATVEKPKVYDFGEVVKDLEGPAPDGRTVKLSDLDIDRAKAEAAVLSTAKAFAGGKEVALGSVIAELPGVQDDGELDASLKMQLVSKAGQRFGLVASEELVERASTLKDVSDWITQSAKSPILVMVWSPKCPMCKGIYDERIQEILGETGVRLFVIAGSSPDKPEAVADYLEGNDFYWRVLLDPEQKIVDRIGGRKTPHLFLLDAERKLQYRGSVDNDPRDSLDGDERKEYFRDAIEAIRAGKPVEVSDTEPAG